MATNFTLDLPIKRPNEEIGSGSGSNEAASKKAKLEGGSGVPDLKTFDDFSDYSGDETDPFVLYHEQEDMTRRCKLQEIRYYLISKGQVDRAENIQSEMDLDDEEFEDFEAKNWELNALVGPYDDYQRLVVKDDFVDCAYRDFMCSHVSDIAYLDFFEELKEAMEKISSLSNAPSIYMLFTLKMRKLTQLLAIVPLRKQSICGLWKN